MNRNVRFRPLTMPTLAVIFAVMFANAAYCATYYVDSRRGDDSAEGTAEEQAWQTLRKVSSTPFRPGDRILFRKGEVWEGSLTVTSNGKKNEPITYGSFGHGERPRIVAARPLNEWEKVPDTERVYNVSLPADPAFVYSTTPDGAWSRKKSIDRVDHAPRSYFYDKYEKKLYVNIGEDGEPRPDSVMMPVQRCCIQSTGEEKITDYIVIEGLHLEGASQEGIFSAENNAWAVRDCLIENCGTAGIRGQGAGQDLAFGWIVENNRIGRLNCEATVNRFRAGILLMCVDGPEIRSNRVATVNSIGIMVSRIAESSPLSRDVRVHHNELTDCQSNIHVFNTEGARTYANYIHDSKGVGICNTWRTYHGEIFYNLIYNLRQSDDGTHYNGIDINCDAQHIKIYNNTVVKVERCCCTIEDYFKPCNGCVIKNNIFDARDNYLPHAPIMINSKIEQVEIGHNIYIPTSSRSNVAGHWKGQFKDMAAWVQASGDAGSMELVDADSLFVEPGKDFHLKPGASAIDAGVDVGLDKDFDGCPIRGQPDIGAFEFTGSGGN